MAYGPRGFERFETRAWSWERLTPRTSVIPALYRAHVEDLLATLSEETIAGRAADELHELIETVIVEWDGKIRKHRLELRGNLLAMLNKTKPAGGAGFEGQQSSLKLVAGARIGLCRTRAHHSP